MTHINREREATEETLLCVVQQAGGEWLDFQSLPLNPGFADKE